MAGMPRRTATCSPSSVKSSGALEPRLSGPTFARRRADNGMRKHRHVSTLIGLLLMTASAGAGQTSNTPAANAGQESTATTVSKGGQVHTAATGQPAERHLSGDQTFREWSMQAAAGDVKRIKVCRVEAVCTMRFKDGVTPRTRVRNLVTPFRY